MGGILSGIGASKAAKSNARATTEAQRLQTIQQNKAIATTRQAGRQASQLFAGLAPSSGRSGKAIDYELGLRRFKPEHYQGFEETPGYDFRLSEGMKAIQNSAAARGGLNSGATMKALQRFGQDYASNEYNNHVNRLFARDAIDRGVASSRANALLGVGSNVSGIQLQQGNTMAAGTIGAANQRGMATQALFGIPQAQHELDLATANTAANAFGSVSSFFRPTS